MPAFDWEVPRAREGYYALKPGTNVAIARAKAWAPFADLLWMETAKPEVKTPRPHTPLLPPFLPPFTSPLTSSLTPSLTSPPSAPPPPPLRPPSARPTPPLRPPCPPPPTPRNCSR